MNNHHFPLPLLKKKQIIVKHVTEIGHDTFKKISSSTKCQGFCGLDEMKYQ